jgi:beta-mannosidase
LICRNADLLANVEAEVTQQLLRLGSHASLAVFGGNNEVEQSLEWYQESRDSLPLFATDYSTLFEDTIGKLVQQVGAE